MPDRKLNAECAYFVNFITYIYIIIPYTCTCIYYTYSTCICCGL